MAPNWFTRRQKESATLGATLSMVSGRAAWTDFDLETYATEGYEANADVHTAVNVLARAGAGVEWYAKRIDRNGDEERLDTHPMINLLRRPNPRQANTQFIFEYIASRAIFGQTYVERVGPKNGPPRELYILPAYRMSVVPGNSLNPVLRYEYKVGSKTTRLDPHLILHHRRYHPTDDFYGLSPLAAAAKLVDQASAAYDWNLSLLQNGATPSGFLSTEGDLSDPQFERLSKDISRWGRAKNAGRPRLLEGGLKWQSAGHGPSEMQFLEAQKLFARKFAMVINVPPELVDGEAKKFANYAEARKALYVEGVLPELDEIRDELNAWLAPLFGDGVTIEYDRDDIEALQEDRNALYERAERSTFLKVNEKRVMVGLDPIDGPEGDAIMVGMSLAPLSYVAGAGSTEPAAKDEPAGDDDSEAALAEGKTKALGLRSEEAKTAYWKFVDQKRTRLERVVEGIVATRLASDTDAVVAAIEGAKGPLSATVATERALDQQRKAWVKDLERIYLTVGEPFAEGVLDDLGKSATLDRVHATPEWQRRLAKYIARVGAAKVTQVLDTTKKRIADAIDAGISEQEGIPELARRVKESLDGASTLRARTIARTETVAASNAASMAAAESTGLPLVKEWISTRDERTRSSHESMDGETAGMEDAFTLDGGEVLFPGDGSLGVDAGEVVNCRCTHAFQVSE